MAVIFMCIALHPASILYFTVLLGGGGFLDEFSCPVRLKEKERGFD